MNPITTKDGTEGYFKDRRESLYQRSDYEIAPAQYLPEAERFSAALRPLPWPVGAGSLGFNLSFGEQDLVRKQENKNVRSPVEKFDHMVNSALAVC
jgi:hypothetical protein